MVVSKYTRPNLRLKTYDFFIMSKKILTLLALIFIASCQLDPHEEIKKTGKAAAASSRINATDGNSKDLLKELNKKDE